MIGLVHATHSAGPLPPSKCVIPEEDPNRIIDGLDDDKGELSRMMGEGEGDNNDRGDDDMEDGGESASEY